MDKQVDRQTNERPMKRPTEFNCEERVDNSSSVVKSHGHLDKQIDRLTDRQTTDRRIDQLSLIVNNT